MPRLASRSDVSLALHRGVDPSWDVMGSFLKLSNFEFLKALYRCKIMTCVFSFEYKYIYIYVDGIGKSMRAFAVFFVEMLQLFAPMPVRMKMPDADRDGRPRTSFAKARAQTHQRRICQQPYQNHNQTITKPHQTTKYYECTPQSSPHHCKEHRHTPHYKHHHDHC